MLSTAIDWTSRKLFNIVHGRNLIYNSCWEDPRLDREAMNIGKDDSILVITSAGCNTLDYVLDEPKHIYAVDINPKQNFLLELKIAGIKALDFESFFEVFGQGYSAHFADIYQTKMRRELSPQAQIYWDWKVPYFSGTRFTPSFYLRGTSGLAGRLINFYFDKMGVTGAIKTAFEANDLSSQKDIYYAGIKPYFWTRMVDQIISWDLSLSLFGVPRSQRKQIDNTYLGGVSQFIKDCVETIFTAVPLKDNYFWWLYVNGRYSPDRCPEYLKESNFAKLRSQVDKISIHTTSVEAFLSQTKEPVTKYILLDHMDWLSTVGNCLQKEWQAITNNIAQTKQILWRSGGMHTEYINDIPVTKNSITHRLGEYLQFDREKAAILHSRDRVGTYGSFHIAQMCG